MSGAAGPGAASQGAAGRVIGIGSMVVDRMHRVPRVLGPGEKGILRSLPGGGSSELRVGGVMLNQLGWAAALGLPVGLIGKQADDEPGRFLRAAMDRLGIARQIVLDGSASSFADIYIDDSGERAIYMAPGATAETTPEHVREHHVEWIRGAARVSSEVSQVPLGTVAAVFEIARDAGVPTVLDLDVPPSDAVPGLGSEEELLGVVGAADLLKPAKAAARELVPEAGDDPLAVAEALRSRFGNGAVAVTDGGDGCAVAMQGGSLRIPALGVGEVVDTTGAGDAFLGGLLFALGRSLGWEDAGRLANACGASCVERLGAFPEQAAEAVARVRELYDGPGLEVDP